jgi:GNAT superfamily N-acetyltransferase
MKDRKSVPRVRMVFDQDLAPGIRHIIELGVDLHNVAVTGLADWYPVAVLLKDADDAVRGGVLGDIWGGWLHIKYVWVDRPLRHRGHASRMVAAAERYARDRGAHDACLDTFSFQARPLYEKLGYEVFGVLENFPPGHSRYFLKKRLTKPR